jgi:hypothetical protein
MQIALLAMICMISSHRTFFVSANGVEGEYYLEGIGYREQELQAAKGTRFRSEAAAGVEYASLGGYTHIFIKG